MKLSKATTFLALCAVSLLATNPSVVQGATVQPAAVTIPGHETATATTTVAATTTTKAETTTVAVTSTTTVQTVTHTTTVAVTTTAAATTKAVTTTTAATVAPVVSTTTASVTPTTVPVSSSNGTCVNSSTCSDGLICVQTSANATTGVCEKISTVCAMSPVTTCLTSADCPLAFSYCTLFNGQNMCTGMGVPGTSTACTDSSSGGLMTTVKFAGIAVGAVAALGLAFALVRWQRRRQRSKMPAEMFGEIDYGMTDRSAAAPKAVESYPFSSRPNAHGSDHAPLPPSMAHDYNSGYDNNQYYEEPVGYHNKMQQDQYYGHDQYDNQYNGNPKDGGGYGGGYGGYDQHSGHGGGGHGGGDGFYDNAGYDDYGHHGVGHASPVASPAAVAQATSPRHQNFNTMDNYGVEPTELDFGGHGQGHGGGHGGGQGEYGGHY
ncbi:hypothetical protein BGZ58_003971 [Dissophora ornata]|nr:hypothetical protein BGZ58_003971 [Dissophora ornata]